MGGRPVVCRSSVGARAAISDAGARGCGSGLSLDEGRQTRGKFKRERFAVLNDGKPQTVRLISRDSGGLPPHAVIRARNQQLDYAALAKMKNTTLSIVSSFITNDMETGAPSLAAVVTVSDEVRIVQDFHGRSGHFGRCLRQALGKQRVRGRLPRWRKSGMRSAYGEERSGAPRHCADQRVARPAEQGSFCRCRALKAQQDQSPFIHSPIRLSPLHLLKRPQNGNRPINRDGADPTGQGGINLLAIGMELARLAKVNVAEALAQATGGGHDKFTTLHGLETQLSAIGTEIHNRYTLTFVQAGAATGRLSPLIC